MHYTAVMSSDFFRNMAANVLTIFRGKNLWWHALAITFTAALVFTGADWWFFEHTRSSAFEPFILTAGIGGFFVPVLAPIGIYFWGEYRKNRSLMNTGAAVAQAELIGYLVSILYKVFTGRTQPEFLTHFSNLDISHAFHFGILQNGVFWGWPSSHAVVAFAGATALVLMSKHRPIRVGAALYAMFVGFGAAVGFHWLSDVLAGAIIGILVGGIVAKSYSALVKTPSTSS